MVKILILLLVITICGADFSNIVRPCHLDHLQCIRENLAANSHCRRNVKGFIPNVYEVKEFRFETPFFNSTYIDKNLIVRNHDKCKVKEFYFNTKTDVALLGIECLNLTLVSDRVLIQHRTMQEDTYYNYRYSAVYPQVLITVNLPSSTHMNLCEASIFTDVTALPKFRIDPKDKPTANFLATDLSLLNIFERETFFYRGYSLAKYFIDSLICDYGCSQELLSHKPLYKNY